MHNAISTSVVLHLVEATSLKLFLFVYTLEQFVRNAASIQINLAFYRQRHDNEFCDITLEVEEKQFAAHRSVLAACSQYFYKMFTVNVSSTVIIFFFFLL